jgi:hypothetical protein
VEEPVELLRVEELEVEAWAGDERNVYFRFGVSTLAGRRIEDRLPVR